MSSETVQTEWRRGGDPANPPIDRVGVWERRNGPHHTDYLIRSLCPDGLVQWRDIGETRWRETSTRVGNLQKYPHDYRYIGPLPGSEPAAAPKKGDREAFRRKVGDFNRNCVSGVSVAYFNEIALDFLESPAGRAAVLGFLGVEEGGNLLERLRDARESVSRLTAELAEAREENDAYRKVYGCLSCDEQHDRGTMCPPHEVRSSDPHWKQRIASLAAERDALRSEVALLREAERSAQGRVAELEKYDAELTKCCTALERWPAASGCNGHLCVSGHIENILERVAELESRCNGLTSGIETERRLRHQLVEGCRAALNEHQPLGCFYETIPQRIRALVLNVQGLESHLSAQSAAEKREDGEKEPPLNRDEAIRRLWAMARGQRDQIEDLQERVKVLE